MLFFIYSLSYFINLFIALWFLYFLLKNIKNNNLHRAMALGVFVACLWYGADFFTLVNFENNLSEMIWKISFFTSWSLVAAISIFIFVFTKMASKATYYVLSFVYLAFSYFILFTNFVVDGIRPLQFAGESNYIIGPLFSFLGAIIILILLLDFYFILQNYLHSKKQREKSINKVLLWAMVIVVFLPSVSNILLPYFNISFPRLAALSIACFIVVLIYLINKYKAFSVDVRVFNINTKVSLVFIFISMIPVFLISIGFYRDTIKILQEEELQNERFQILAVNNHMDDFFEQAREDVIFLSNLTSFNTILNSNDELEIQEAQTRLGDNFLQFSKNRNIYNQIRYIDEFGNEKVRVNNYDGKLWEVAEDELQNKADRYYFKEAMDLDAGFMYVSDIDLNVENGQIEVPYNPTVRYARKLFDFQGNSKGIVIVNISLKNMFLETKEIFGSSGDLYIVNSDGYFLLHPDSKREWGFMFDREEDNIFEDNQEIAQKIFSTDQDQFTCFDNKCYVSFTKLFVREGDQLTNSYNNLNQEDYVVIYSIVDSRVLLNTLNKALYDIYVLILLILLIIFIISFIFSKLLTRPIDTIQLGIAKFSKGDLDYRLPTDRTDELGDLSLAFNVMAQAIQDSRIEVDKKVKEQTKEIIKNAQALEDQQDALLNVLEDVEDEKEKTSLLARDLEKFKLAVDNASDHIAITDENGIAIYGNRAVSEITGYSIEEIEGKKVGTKDLWGGLMPREFYKKLWRTIKVEKKTFEGYMKNRRKNGQEYEAFVSISPVLDEHGHVKFFVAIERDVTKEKEIDRAKSEFVSLASHQLRTPLSTINWYAEILLSGDAGKISDEQKEYLGEIYKGNQRMVDLVNALLNVSRIDLGTLAVEPEPTDLKDLAESVFNEMKPQIANKKLKVNKKYDKKLAKINLDPKLMRIVFQNLLSNAVKYTPDKGNVSLDISVISKDVKITVKDSGMGIPSYQQKNIFTKLFRADNAREKETDGTGLGLYIVKSVIEQFGGKVGFKSVENKGTTFYATIPTKGVKAKEGTKGLEYTK